MVAKFPRIDGSQPCAEDPELWFPPPGVKGNHRWHRAAVAKCLECPFVDPCREYAVDHIEFGVWGATTNADRNKIRKETGRVAIPPISFGMNPSTTGVDRRPKS